MKSDKPPAADASENKEEQDLKKVEEKVKRMLDPSVPDSEPEGETELPKDLPTKISIKVDSEKPASSAPEVDKDEAVPEPPAADENPVEEEKQVPGLEEENKETSPEEDSSEESEIEPAPELDDDKTNQAVDDIIKEESNKLLEAEDEKSAKSTADQKPPRHGGLKNALGALFHSKRTRRLTIFAVFLGLAATLAIPSSRYFMLNSAGVRSSASIKILDESTRQPLRNVQVNLQEQSALTDDNGVARLKNLKLGTSELVVKKRAFSPVKQKVVLGWGSNPLGERSITPVGSQYSFIVKDFISDKPIKKAEATSGEASAFSDEDGRIKLTIDKTDDEPVEVSITGQGLREEKIVVDANEKSEHAVMMVPGRKHIFISKRSGRYDVYKIDVDGKNEERILAGTGSERDDMALVPHHSKESVALVSTRGNKRNSQGYLISTLTLIDLSDNSTVDVAQSERIQIIDWIGDKLVYVSIVAGASAEDPKRHRLMSYDQESFESKELASSNLFNDVMTARGVVYYAPSSTYNSGGVAFYRVEADGSNRHVIMNQETWSIFRTGYNTLTFAIGQDWYGYNLQSKNSDKLDGEPPDLRNRSYVDGPGSVHSLWVDRRDGKGVLLAFDLKKNEDIEIHKRSGLKSPIRWLNDNSVVFRIGTDEETADYAVSLDGGKPKKIRDVTNTSGIEDWYYY